MSFAATAALIGAYAGVVAAPSRRGVAGAVADQGRALKLARHLGGYAIGLAATSLIAGTATAVFGAYHFQRVSPLSLAANLAAMPFVSVMVMPFAMFAMILMPFGLDGWAFCGDGQGAVGDDRGGELVFRSCRRSTRSGWFPVAAVIVLTIALVLATLPTTWLRIAALPMALARPGDRLRPHAAGCRRSRKMAAWSLSAPPTARLRSAARAPMRSPRKTGKRR